MEERKRPTRSVGVPKSARFHENPYHALRNRVYDDYQHLLRAGADAWQHRTPAILKSVCACPYLTPVFER